MCAVSMIGDQFGRDYWPKKYPDVFPPAQPAPSPVVPSVPFIPVPEVTKADLDEVRKEIQELKKLLLAAKKFDEKTGQPDCEIDDKVAVLKKVAELVGVDLSEVFPSKRRMEE